jgi:hypothetical protein
MQGVINHWTLRRNRSEKHRLLGSWNIETPPHPKKKIISIICEAKNYFVGKRHGELNSLMIHKQEDEIVHNLNLDEFNMLCTHHEKTDFRKSM